MVSSGGERPRILDIGILSQSVFFEGMGVLGISHQLVLQQMVSIPSFIGLTIQQFCPMSNSFPIGIKEESKSMLPCHLLSISALEAATVTANVPSLSLIR